MKEKKERKAPNPNGMFRKPIPEKKFEKKYLGMIEQKADRELLASSFELKDGRYGLKPGLGREPMVKLNKLAKAIKANRGLLKAGPLIALVLLVGGLAVFVLFFMNPLLERALESALQGLFDAKAEVSALRFEPWRMRMGMSALSVADAQAPMTNLFETGRIELRLNPSAILRGKVYVEEAAVESLAFGTARKSSGALPGKETDAGVEAAPVEKKARPAMVDFSKFDAKALLEREKANLKSLAAYEKAGASYEEASARWKGRVENSRAAVESLKTSSKKVLAIDPKSIRTPDQAANAIKDANAALAEAKKAGAEADSAYKDISKDAETLKALATEAKSAYSADLAYMKALVDPKSGAAMSILEPVLKDILSDSGEKYLRYGRRGLELAERLKTYIPKKGSASAGEKKEKAKKAKAPRGRDVAFPSGAYPAFRLGRLFSSFNAEGRDWKVELLELSTDPDLVGSPARLSVDVTGKGSSVKATGLADLRSASKDAYSLTASCSGLPFDLGDALSSAGLSGFSGTLAADADLSGGKDGSVKAKADLDVGSPRVAKASGTLGTAVTKALAKAGKAEASVSYAKPSGGKDAFSLKTNLDKIVRDAVIDMASQYAKKALADLEKEMKRYFSEELEGKLGSQADFDALLALAKGDKASGEQIKKSLDAKLAELETKAKTLATDAVKGAATGAAAGAAGAAAGAAGSLPKVNLPKLP